MSKEEQDTRLVSRKSEFQINVDTGYCFVAEDQGEIIGFILAHKHYHLRTLYILTSVLILRFKARESIITLQRTDRKSEAYGYKRDSALINTDNPKSVRLHEKADLK